MVKRPTWRRVDRQMKYRKRRARLNFEGLESRNLFASDGMLAVNDIYDADVNLTLEIEAPGVLANDSTEPESMAEAILYRGPRHGTLDMEPDGSFSYQPDTDYEGVDRFLYWIQSGDQVSNLAVVTIVVANDAPEGVNDRYSLLEDQSLIVTSQGVLGNDIDDDPGDANPLKAILDSEPEHGQLVLNDDGTFEYQPDSNFFGTDAFIYQAFDGQNYSSFVVVELEVQAVNDAPEAENDSFSIEEDDVLVIAAPGVLDNDSDVEQDPLTVQIDSDPEHGTVQLNDDGSFTYTPDPDFSGMDAFSYLVSDGQDESNVAVVEILVEAVNDIPQVENDEYTVDEDTPLLVSAIGVLANDSDADDDPLSAVLVEGPEHGQLVLSSDGSFEYTPDEDFFGTDAFSYRASDGQEESDVGAVEITIRPVNDPPVAQPDSYTTEKGQKLVVAAPGILGNDSDVENDQLTIVPGDGPQHGQLSLQPDGSFEYTPDPTFRGTDQFTYRVTDGMDQSPLTTVTIQVGGTNTRPVANNDAYFAIVDTPLAVNAANGLIKNDTDAEGDLLVASLYRGPRFGTLTLAPDGSFQYQPNSGFIGIDSFLYRVSDGEVTSRLAAVTLHVRPGTTSAIQAAALKSLAASRMDVALSGIADQAFLIPDTTMDSLATDIRRRNLGRKVL